MCVAMYIIVGIALLCSVVANGQPEPASFELHSTKTNKELTLGETDKTIQAWATWTCAISENLDSYESRWFFNNTQLSRTGRKILRDGNLFTEDRGPGTAILIQNLSYFDQGRYDCQVRGTDPLTTWVSLSITLSLVFHLNTVASVVHTFNDSLHVDIGCDMSGFIPRDENLFWIIDGEEIHASEYNGDKYRITYRDGDRKAQTGGIVPTASRVSVLSVYDVELSDTKTYSCSVVGMVAAFTENVQLNVTEASRPDGFPPNIQVEVVSSTEVLVTWEEVLEEERRGNITHYEVFCLQSTFDNIPPVTKQTEGPVLSLLIENLEEFVQYNISVRAHTLVGPGPFSPHEVAHTLEDAPTGTPRNLSVISVGTKSLDVSWSRPDDISINGLLRLYTVEYCPLSEEDDDGVSADPDCRSFNVSAETTHTLLKYLELDTLYNVSVAAYTIETGLFASNITRTGPVKATKSHRYSIVGTVVGIILAILALIIITGIVYGGVSYQCQRKRKETQLLSEQGSTVSVSTSKDPELVLIPVGDGIALMRQLSADPSFSSTYSVGEELHDDDIPVEDKVTVDVTHNEIEVLSSGTEKSPLEDPKPPEILTSDAAPLQHEDVPSEEAARPETGESQDVPPVEKDHREESTLLQQKPTVNESTTEELTDTKAE